jgi:hypothetical protein
MGKNKYRHWNRLKGDWEEDEIDYNPYCNYPYYGVRYAANSVANEMWDSGWVTHEKHTLFISQAMVGVCNSLQAKFPGLEWAILLKGEWTKFGFEISNKYAIPKQKVTAGSVKFDDEDVEKYKVDGFNVVLHSHHNMGISFSGSDHDTLTDSSFLASLLYSKGEIKEATISITVKEGVRVAISPTIQTVGFLTELPDGIEQVIEKTTYSYSTNDNWHGDHKVYDKGKTDLTKEDNVLVKAEDGTLSDSYGIPYYGGEEKAKGEGYEIITEEEDLKRFCDSKKDDTDYNFGGYC